jgi:putative Holliday junction resolvase
MPDERRRATEPQSAPARHSGAPELVLGCDFGTRRVGVAIGDTLTGRARALATLEHRGHAQLHRDIERLLARYAPSRIVVGIPYNMSGTETSLTRPALAFARGLRRKFPLPVGLVDERLSSREAEAELSRARREGRRRRRVAHGDVDGEAARIIVERWLAGERHLETEGETSGESPAEPRDPA